MKNQNREPTCDDGVAALALLEQALALIDQMELPVEVAAHVDLAIQRLRLALVQPASGGAPD